MVQFVLESYLFLLALPTEERVVLEWYVKALSRESADRELERIWTRGGRDNAAVTNIHMPLVPQEAVDGRRTRRQAER